jgi:hypothetical protein
LTSRNFIKDEKVNGITLAGTFTTILESILIYNYNGPEDESLRLVFASLIPILSSAAAYFFYRLRVKNELPIKVLHQQTLINEEIKQIEAHIKCKHLTPEQLEKKKNELFDAKNAKTIVLREARNDI